MRTNARAVDLELNTLKNVFKFAVRSGWLQRNPLEFRHPAYCNGSSVRHCRECAPRSAEELHAHARFFFEDPATEALGWQVLFEAFTGARTSEALALRMDAKTYLEPGFVQEGVLWVARAKGGVNNWVNIHPALETCILSHAAWHRRRFPAPRVAEWYFPSPDGQKLSVDRLSKALRRSSRILHPGYHVTSHGLRSYYVTVRRCQGASDAQIAIELGQRTGPSLIVQVYGDNRPAALDWLPVKPAWEVWQPMEEAK